MAAPSCSDDEFIALMRDHGTKETAAILKVSTRSVQMRRRRLERTHGAAVKVKYEPTAPKGLNADYPIRIKRELRDGLLFTASDAHFWPGERTVAFRAFLALAKELKPKIIVMNGDILDGASISRHPPIGWARTPSLKEELEAVDERLDEIRESSPRSEFIWLMGNHDLRFESKLALNAGEFEGVKGTRLRDHFPHWEFAWSLWINESLVIKHRWKGGIHATHNNALNAGKSIETGHLHSLKVTPLDDYNGTRYGIDTGTLSDPYGSHTEYMEDNPRNHRSGFIVNTFSGGKLLWPEPVAAIDDKHVQFRGRIIKV